MPIPSESGHSFRVRAPCVLTLGADSAIRFEDRLGGELVEPNGGTCTVYGSSSRVISTGAVDIVDGVATYTVPAEDLDSTVTYGDGYRAVAVLTYDAGPDQTATAPCFVAKYPLQCPVTQADLEDLYEDLGEVRTATGSLQRFIDTAWAETLRTLVGMGRWPEAFVDPDQLFDAVRHAALANVFRWLVTQGRDMSTLARDHETKAASAWGKFRSRQDLDQDGAADSPDRTGGTSVVSLRGGDSGTTQRVSMWRGRVFRGGWP